MPPDTEPVMRPLTHTPTPARAKTLTSNLAAIQTRITAATTLPRPVRLVAVSKLKPATDILALYHAPSSHRHFGENYQQELTLKAQLLPRDINWHFIGALQTNKCKPLAAQVENLWCVASVDSAKKADALDAGRAQLAQRMQTEGNIAPGPLRVQVQVNTSGEEAKAGVAPADAVALCMHIRDQCAHLHMSGLMTIGAIARSKATGQGVENEDFKCLVEVREHVCRALGVDKSAVELGMGMSSDFEGAIAMGSDEVRVGSDIFGERPPKSEARVVESDGE